MITCNHPRCVECDHPLPTDDIHPGGRWLNECCAFCRASLQVRRTPDGYAVRSRQEAMRMQTTPLPAVASPALRDRFFGACRSVVRLLQPGEGVEPGMATIDEWRS